MFEQDRFWTGFMTAANDVNLFWACLVMSKHDLGVSNCFRKLIKYAKSSKNSESVTKIDKE